MIQIYENTNWISQHYFELVLLCLIVAVLALSVFGAATSFILEKKRFVKYSKVVLPISFCVLIISGYALFSFSSHSPHYSGSGDYKVKNVKQNASGDQILIIDDGKRDVELKVDDKGKTSYSRGDDVRVTVNDKGSSLSKGEYHLGDALRPQHRSPSSIIINVTYEIEKTPTAKQALLDALVHEKDK